MLFKGVFPSCEGVEEVFGAALTLEVFSVVILLDVLYFPDFILVEILLKVFLLSFRNLFQMGKGAIVPVATIYPNFMAFHFFDGLVFEIIGNHDFFHRNVMMFRTFKLTMIVILTIFTLVYFV